VIRNSLTYILVLLGSVKSGEITQGFAQCRNEQNNTLIKVLPLISAGRIWLVSSVCLQRDDIKFFVRIFILYVRKTNKMHAFPH